MNLTISDLTDHLMETIDFFEKKADPVKFKIYIFTLFFFKRLSDQFEEEYSTIGGNPEDPDNYKFYFPENARWGRITRKSEAIGKEIDDVLLLIEEANQESLGDIFRGVQFNKPSLLSDEILTNLVVHFSKFSLADTNLDSDKVIGGAFRRLLSYFADYERKKVTYSPEGVIETLVKILTPQEGFRICDPACGSGGMLIGCFDFLKESGMNPLNLSLMGEEKHDDTYIISKMNLLLHGILNIDMKHDDSMKSPITDDAGLMKFNIVLANPFWNDDEWSIDLFKAGDPYNRIKYDIPPKNSGDWMWIQHMFASLNSEGRMGIVLDNGALFRGKKEKRIRKGFVDDNFIEGIIALPDKLFYKGSGPGCIIIINKKKSVEFQNKIFFVHAENEYEERKARNFLTIEHIDKIVTTYTQKKVIEKFSAIIDLEEIKENDYNLNVSRYIDILPEEERINLDECLNDILTIIIDRRENERKFKINMNNLGHKEFSKRL